MLSCDAANRATKNPKKTCKGPVRISASWPACGSSAPQTRVSRRPSGVKPRGLRSTSPVAFHCGRRDNGVMPTYAYRCRSCSENFELRRSMDESSDPASCPNGHDDTVKLLNTVALGASSVSAPSAQPAGGGCCGGGCCG
ncbi:MAG: FmdB family zinc ribbon protein [Micromonosporaceae bacterium]